MKVCLLSYEFPPHVGGEASYTAGLAVSLCRMGTQVVVVTSSLAGAPDPNPWPAGLEVIRLRSISRQPLRIASFRAAASRILSRLPGIDLVHQTNDYFPPPLSRKPVDIVTIHHPFGAEARLARIVLGKREAPRYLRRRRMTFLRVMQKLACRSSPRVISVSKFTAQALIEECALQPEKLTIFPNGVLVEEFDNMRARDEARSLLNLPDSDHILVHVGRFDHNKDLPTLLTAFRAVHEEYPESKLLLVGSGPLQEWTARTISQMDLQRSVIMLGSTNRRTLLDAYAASDVVVLSSLMEGFGIVLAEAMAAQRPCVATRCGGTPEVVLQGRTGLLVPPRDAQAMSDAIARILSDPKLASRYGRAGRRRVDAHFDWGQIARRMERYYRNLLPQGD